MRGRVIRADNITMVTGVKLDSDKLGVEGGSRSRMGKEWGGGRLACGDVWYWDEGY